MLNKHIYKRFSENIKYVSATKNDLKKFQKVFTEEEKIKYLDPYGFMNENESNIWLFKKLVKFEAEKSELDSQKNNDNKDSIESTPKVTSTKEDKSKLIKLII